MAFRYAGTERVDHAILESRAASIGALFRDRVHSSSGSEAFQYFEGKQLASVTWAQVKERVYAMAAGLMSLGIELEDRVAIASHTRYEWAIADLAIMCAGGATTTVYPSTMAEDVAYILADSGSKVVFAEDDGQVEKLRQHRSEIPDVVQVITFDLGDEEEFEDEWIITLGKLERIGRRALSHDPGMVDQRIDQIGPANLALLIYTSGTTGRPKGAEITQDAIVYEGASIASVSMLNKDDLQFLWLPLSHIFGKILLTLPLQIGFPTAIDGQIDRIIDHLAIVKPTFMGAAPRIFEKAYARISMMLAQEEGLKRRLMDWAFDIGQQTVEARAQGDRVSQLEPLPDIDFNIRAGNTLVGYVSIDEIRRAAAQVNVTGKDQTQATQVRMVDTETDAVIHRIGEDAELVEKAFAMFHTMQTDHAMDAQDFAAAKGELRRRLYTLSVQLDRYLAREYGKGPEKKPAFVAWRKSHMPFHWFAEFYGIMRDGGFDVVIGNPPYVSYSVAKVGYSVEPLVYRTIDTKNLYPLILERSLMLASGHHRVAMIVQLTAVSSERMGVLQDLLQDHGQLAVVPFPRRPESIFDGVEMPVAILRVSEQPLGLYETTRVGRFYTEERPFAMAEFTLMPHNARLDGYRIAKLGSQLESRLLDRVLAQDLSVDRISARVSPHRTYYQEACRYWLKSALGVPFFRRNGERVDPPHGRYVHAVTSQAAAFIACLLNSSLFYWYYSMFSDCEHVNDNLMRRMLIPGQWPTGNWQERWQVLSASLMASASRKQIRTQQGHDIEYDEIRASRSKAEIDAIDVLLATHYGFTDEELDFIINYDIKYRMGADADTEAAP